MRTLQHELGAVAEDMVALREAHNIAFFKLELLTDMWAMRALDVQGNAF